LAVSSAASSSFLTSASLRFLAEAGVSFLPLAAAALGVFGVFGVFGVAVFFAGSAAGSSPFSLAFSAFSSSSLTFFRRRS
jgi:hypothetical protein